MAFPGTYNINYYEGDTYEFKIYPKNSAGDTFEITDYSAKFTIANGRGSTIRINGENTTVTQYECLANINEDSSVTCIIPPAIGRNLVAGTSYVYDVQIRNTSAVPEKVYTLLTGTLSVTADVTGAL